MECSYCDNQATSIYSLYARGGAKRHIPVCESCLQKIKLKENKKENENDITEDN